MNDLIAITQATLDGAMRKAVDARELHAFLEVKSQFRDWIKNRIADFGFVQGVDFLAANFLAGSDRIDYLVTLDMAKELAMVERNEQGKKARLYFIECERRAKAASADPMAVLADPKQLLALTTQYAQRLLAAEEKLGEQAVIVETQQRTIDVQATVVEKQAATIEAQAPKIAALETIAASNGSFCITDAAKTLQVRPKDLFDYLRRNGWIYRRAGSASDIGYQSKILAGYLEHKTTTVSRSDGSEKTVTQVRVTTRGVARLGELLAASRSTTDDAGMNGTTHH